MMADCGCFDECAEWSSVEDEQEVPENRTLRHTTGMIAMIFLVF